MKQIPMNFALMLCAILCSCNGSELKKEEHLTVREQEVIGDSLGNSIKGGSTFRQLVTSPNSVLQTGMDRFRLIPIYKIRKKSDRSIDLWESTTYDDSRSTDENGNPITEEDSFKYFMPGMDIIYGYNLVNIAHQDMQTGKLSYFFEKPALIRAVYFPGVKSDSLNMKPVFRDFFLVSAYDSDTNRDTLINKKDMRRLYHIDQLNSVKTSLLPPHFSAIRSTYDYKIDVMYIYTRYDANKNGRPERNEPVSIFWINLREPAVARQMI